MQHNTKLLLILARPNHAHARLLLTSLSDTDTTHLTPFHCNFKLFAFSIWRTFRSMLHVTCISHTWLCSYVITINTSTCRLSTADILLYCAVRRSKIASWKHSIFCSIALNPHWYLTYRAEGAWHVCLSVCLQYACYVARRHHVSLFRRPPGSARYNHLISLGTPVPVPWSYTFSLSVGPSARTHTELSGSLHRTLQSSRLAACIDTKEHKVCSVFCVSIRLAQTAVTGWILMQSNVFCQVGTGLLNISRWT